MGFFSKVILESKQKRNQIWKTTLLSRLYSLFPEFFYISSFTREPSLHRNMSEKHLPKHLIMKWCPQCPPHTGKSGCHQPILSPKSSASTIVTGQR